MKKKQQFYSLTNILKKNCDYNVIFGERSNGKTYALLEYMLQRYIKTGEQSAYIRRWRADLIGKRAESLFANHVANGVISTLTKGKYNEVFYISGKWYLSLYNHDTGKRYPCAEPFCYAFALSEQEHDKSTSYPNITTIVFDEFLTRRYYLPDEFMLFMNVLSTIIRQRDNVHIYMLGNTVNKFCPYFAEMGLHGVTKMAQDTIDVYSMGDKGATIAVEYCGSLAASKESNKYFAFNNEKLQMITGGKWELDVYPHLPVKYRPKDVLYVFYIIFGDTTLQGNIISVDNSSFIYIHLKTTPIKEQEDTLIYDLKCSNRPNRKRKLLSTATKLESTITKYFAREKVFYQDNEVGDVVRNYIQQSAVNNIVKS